MIFTVFFIAFTATATTFATPTVNKVAKIGDIQGG